MTRPGGAELFFSLVRWKPQSPRWRWQCIAGPPGYRRACGPRECGLARFPFWVARWWGRTAADVLLPDCQYRKGTALYGRCGVWNTGDSWGGCGLFWAWTVTCSRLVNRWYGSTLLYRGCSCLHLLNLIPVYVPRSQGGHLTARSTRRRIKGEEREQQVVADR